MTGTAVYAQGVSYSTNFDSTDTVNGAPATGFTPYSNASTLVDNLDGQNNWGSTDPAPANAQSGTATQINGGADYVGPVGTFFGGTFAGAIGGNQRNTTPSASAPDVVPSTASGGAISLYHPITVGAGASFLTVNVDFTLTSPVSFTSRDSFALSLRNASGNTSLISVNFVPAPDVMGQPSADNVTTTVGTANATTVGAAVLSGTYHLRLTVNAGSTQTYSGTVTSLANGSAFNFNGSLGTSSLALGSVARFSAEWNLANKTISNGGYAGTPGNLATGAGDNVLAFDNLVITVPEPSTYAMMAVGLLGLVGARRWQGRRA